uniref:PDZ domain-containing protein n=1 Tax=Parastrongyloides trichosuri TaxID=131310 RepID=A0A0N4ZHN0_PARTI
MPKTAEVIHIGEDTCMKEVSSFHQKKVFHERDKNVNHSSRSSIENSSPDMNENTGNGVERNSSSSLSMMSEEDAYDEIFEDDLLPLDQLAPYLAHLESQHYYRVEETDELIIMEDQGDVIYEEVVLLRSTLNQRLGLTLCYQHDDRMNQDAIYINEIEKNSVAGNCKRIQIGDQIIQVNGLNVRSRAQAMNEFAKQNLQVTMLLARPFNISYNNTDSINNFEERVGEDTIKALPKNIFSKSRFINRNHTNLSPLPEQSVSLECEIEDDQLTDQHSNNSVLEKDSGLSRGTDSDPDIYTMPYENITKKANYPPVSPPSITSMPQQKRHVNQNESSSNSSKFEKNLEEELKNLHIEMELIKKDCDNLITMSSSFTPPKGLTKKCTNRNLIPGIMKSPILQRPLPTPGGIVNKAHYIGNSSLPNSPILGVRNGGRKHPHFANIIEETSSAYNTGNDSCRSTPNKCDQINFIDSTLLQLNSLNKHQLLAGDSAATMGPYLSSTIGGSKQTALQKSPQKMLNNNNNTCLENQRVGKSQKEVHFKDVPLMNKQNNKNEDKKEIIEEEGTYHTVKNHSKFRLPKYTIKNQVLLSKPLKTSTLKKPKETVKYRPGETTYTRPEDLAATIKLQQQALRKAMANKGQNHYSNSLPSSPIISQANRVSDKLLKHNTQKQSNSLSLTQKVKSSQTADPVNYEWKVKRRSDGSRYIIRRPLRTHQIRAQREEQLNKERTGISTDDDAASEMKLGKFWTREERKKHIEKAKAHKQRQLQKLIEQEKNVPDQMIVNLSNKKMMKKKGQQVFDKFVTIQEFLTHGSRDPNCPVIEGVLSVTTV